MFKKTNRVERILFRGSYSKIHSRYFTLLFVKNNLLRCRFGVVVSKRIDKRAVIRNQVKRRIRECIQELSCRIKPGYDIIFIVKKELGNKSKKECLEIIKTSFVKEQLI